jgi:FtsZ-binding cell division protein ZapB
MSQAQSTMFPDNEARSAILREKQRGDALFIEFNRLRGDAQVFRTEGEAIRREAEILRRDVNAVQTNLDLMLRKIDTKIDDGIRPVSESLQRGVDETQILKNAQQDLLSQLEEARKEVRELRGKVEEMQAGRTNSVVLPDALQQLMEQQRNFEERLNSLAITRK